MPTTPCPQQKKKVIRHITRYVGRGFTFIGGKIGNGILVHCIKFLEESFSIIRNAHMASLVFPIKWRALFDGLTEHFE